MFQAKHFLLLPALLFCIFLSGPLVGMTAGRSEAKNIVSNLHITGFAQDRSEVMWIATAHGLCRYNGYEYIHYFHDSSDPGSIPSDFTSSIYIDKTNTMWITTDKGVCRYNALTDDYSACSFDNDSLRSSFEYCCLEFQDRLLVCGMNGIKTIDPATLTLSRIEATAPYIMQTMVEDDYYQLWAGGMVGQGIVCLNKDLSVIARIPLDESVDIFTSYKAEDGNIWFGTNQGVIVVNPIRKAIVPGPFTGEDSVKLSRLRIKFFHKVGGDTVLIGTENANMQIYNLFTNKLSSPEGSAFFLDDHSVHLTSCYTDRDKNVWVGTFDNGHCMISSSPARFNNDKALNELCRGKFVTRIIEHGEGKIWIGTRYDGLIFYDAETGSHRVYNKQNFAPLAAANTNLIENLYIDSSRQLWIGYENGIVQCRVEDSRIVSYRIIRNVSPSFFMEDDMGRLWTGSSVSGINIYDTKNTHPPLYITLENKWSNVTSIIKLRSGEVLISVYDEGLYIADPNDMSMARLEAPGELAAQLDRTVYLFEDGKGNIWTGGYGKGAAKYNRTTGEYRIYTRHDGLPDNNVLAITEDGNGDVWMSTSYGITRFNAGKETFASFFDYDGTGGNQYHEKSVLRSQSGRIYFGGNHGLTYFDARDIIPQNRFVPVLLDDLKILNVSAPIGGRKSVLQAHISHTASITLNHRQNVFSIDYSGVDFSSSRNIKYAYRLRNFDSDWNYVGDYRRATYSNLSPGVYHFEVKAQNRDGYWNEIPTTLTVRVKAAPWLSSWALTGYALLVIFSVLAGLRLYINIRLGKERIGMMAREHELEKEMADMKIKFFTNISHELRTPLSMIYGPIKQLRTCYGDRTRAEYLMDLVNFNVDNILRLLDQLMDFGKIESDTLSLSVGNIDVRGLVNQLMASYGFYADEKDISLKLEAASEGLADVLADRDKISKIVGNLISNALKYTPHGGNITVGMEIADKLPPVFDTAAPGGNFLVITVTDDGVGMNKEDLKHLFKRYKRFTYNDDYSKNVDGKGIGLNYVKRLVDKHKGKIVARQCAEGKGMVFTVAFPVDRSVYSDNELTTSGELPIPVAGTAPDGTDIPTVRNNEEKPAFEILPNRHTVLVVEDNTGLLLFLTGIIRDKYNVVSASDGMQATAMFEQYDIDVVISDVLMPKMAGFELCGNIKNDPALCHIPVILLTAKTMPEDQVRGYSQGADIYIPKPFDPSVLMMILRNMFAVLDRRSELILNSITVTEQELEIPIGDSKITMNPMDRQFLDKLYAVIDKDLSNCKLNINAVGKEMAFSKTSFYRKIKALTGESPYGFLRVYRLNKAADLLLTQQYTISEIVDLVGFGTHSHFSACFKRQFGVSPKHYTGD